MIKNERQYRATCTQLKLLREALADAERTAATNPIQAAHATALQTDITALENERREFESLREGAFDLEPIAVVERLGTELIRARIACRMTQRSLADAVGKQEQAIQRYEATNYRAASLETLVAISRVIVDAAHAAAK